MESFFFHRTPSTSIYSQVDVPWNMYICLVRSFWVAFIYCLLVNLHIHIVTQNWYTHFGKRNWQYGRMNEMSQPSTVYVVTTTVSIATILPSTTQSTALHCVIHAVRLCACVCVQTLTVAGGKQTQSQQPHQPRSLLSHRQMLSMFFSSAVQMLLVRYFPTASLLHNINSDLTRCKINISKYKSVAIGVFDVLERVELTLANTHTQILTHER